MYFRTYTIIFSTILILCILIYVGMYRKILKDYETATSENQISKIFSLGCAADDFITNVSPDKTYIDYKTKQFIMYYMTMKKGVTLLVDRMPSKIEIKKSDIIFENDTLNFSSVYFIYDGQYCFHVLLTQPERIELLDALKVL